MQQKSTPQIVTFMCDTDRLTALDALAGSSRQRSRLIRQAIDLLISEKQKAPAA